MKKAIKDVSTYLQCCQPQESADAANASIDAFFEELRALRMKHRIADVACVVKTFVKYDEGIGDACTLFHVGDPVNAEYMFAFALGNVQADRREAVNRLVNESKLLFKS